jgi:hypothetical protein
VPPLPRACPVCAVRRHQLRLPEAAPEQDAAADPALKSGNELLHYAGAGPPSCVVRVRYEVADVSVMRARACDVTCGLIHSLLLGRASSVTARCESFRVQDPQEWELHHREWRVYGGDHSLSH